MIDNSIFFYGIIFIESDKMRKNIKQTEAIFPMPVLLVTTYNEDGSTNVMNAAWCTMQDRNHVA